jgi:hypothetical protein
MTYQTHYLNSLNRRHRCRLATLALDMLPDGGRLIEIANRQIEQFAPDHCRAGDPAGEENSPLPYAIEK